ncbi:MAG: methionine adenosyltransferase [Mycobacteriales bacterium]
MRQWTLTSESVTEGHPDKVADQISDSVLDAILGQDPACRVACEALVNTGLAVVAGEITTTADVDVEDIARTTISGIGYTAHELGLDGATCQVLVSLDPQSPDVKVGLDTAYEKRLGLADDDTLDGQGAGDQGMMFGYACDETDDLMPVPIWTAHRLARRLAEVRKTGLLPYLRPDGKTQVSFRYEDGVPVALETVVISAQHEPGVDIPGQLTPDLVEHVIRAVVPDRFGTGYRVIVNPTGTFVRGGPHADCGLTGRKIIVDTYGGAARHGGGAFSGKDPTKTDRCGGYGARWVAKNIVAAGAARRCEVQVSYAIGVARPISMLVETFGTETVDPAKLTAVVDEAFDLRPAAIIRDLDLLRPMFRSTAAYGHFGREQDGFPWEQTSRAAGLAAALGL